jgi:uncharacterized protein YkwD
MNGRSVFAASMFLWSSLACAPGAAHAVRPYSATLPAPTPFGDPVYAPPAPAVSRTEASLRTTLTLSSLEREVLRWTNVERLMRGLPPLDPESKLTRAARGHSGEMLRLGYFDHESPTAASRTPMRRARNAGLRGASLFVGENIARGHFANARELVRAWMESRGHRRNILDPSFRYLGVGVVRQGESLWATQLFSATR